MSLLVGRFVQTAVANVLIHSQFLSLVLLVCVVMHPACVESNNPDALGALVASQSGDVQH